MTNNSYDVIIIGAGPSGIFCAYRAVEEYARNIWGLR